MQMNRVISWMSPSFRKSMRTNRYLFTILMLALAVVYLVGSNLNGTIDFCALAAIWFFGYPHYANWHYNSSTKKTVQELYQHAIDQPVTLELQENCIIEYQLDIETKASYAAIAIIVDSMEYILIRLKSGVIFVLPKSKFIDGDPFMSKLKEKAAAFACPFKQVKV